MKKLLVILLMLVLGTSTAVLAACGNNTPQYTLKYIAGTGGTLVGETTQTVAEGNDGTEVTATANSGYAFTSWSDGSTAATRKDTNVRGDMSITASFTTVSAALFGGGNGTAQTPYLIGTAEHLLNVPQYLSAHFRQTANITVPSVTLSTDTTTPIGTEATPFNGVYDGDDYKLYGVKINSPLSPAGFFGVTGADSVIKNLEIVDADITGGEYAGILVGKANGTITNCAVSGELTTDTPSAFNFYYGGIAGFSANLIGTCAADVTIFLCPNGSSGQIFVGGIAGRAREVIDSIADGSLTVVMGNNYNEYAAYVGGIIGGSTGDREMTVSGCESIANIEVVVNYQAYVGGIIGKGLSVDDCTVDSTITVNINGSSEVNGSVWVGGVMGRGNTVTDCTVDGAIAVQTHMSTAYLVEETWVGGIGGSLASAGDCLVMANVAAYSNGDATYLGGVAGEVGALERCMVAGKLTASNGTANYLIGGIAAHTTYPPLDCSWYYFSDGAAIHGVGSYLNTGAPSDVGCTKYAN